MARVQQFTANPTPASPGPGTNFATGGTNVSGTLAVAKALGEASQVAQQISDARAESQASAAYAKATEEIEALHLEQNLHPDEFRTRSQKILDAHSKSITVPRYRNEFTQRAGSVRARAELFARKAWNEKQLEDTKAENLETYKKFTNRLARATSESEEMEIRVDRDERLAEWVKSGVYSKREAAAIAEGGKALEFAALGEFLLRESPELGLEMAKNGVGAFKDLDADKQQKAISQFERQIERNERRRLAKIAEAKRLTAEAEETRVQAQELELMAAHKAGNLSVDMIDAMGLDDQRRVNFWYDMIERPKPLPMDANYVNEKRSQLASDPNAFAYGEPIDPAKAGSYFADLQKSRDAIRKGAPGASVQGLAKAIQERVKVMGLEGDDARRFYDAVQAEINQIESRKGYKASETEKRKAIGTAALAIHQDTWAPFDERTFLRSLSRDKDELAEPINGVPATIVGPLSDLMQSDPRFIEVDEFTLREEYDGIVKALNAEGKPTYGKNGEQAILKAIAAQMAELPSGR